MPREFQSRYVAYAAAHRMEPAEILELDKQKYPGGRMCGYILWISERWTEYKSLNPGALIDKHRRFDLWLETSVRSI